MRISDWSSDVCSSDLVEGFHLEAPPVGPERAAHAFLGQAAGDLVGLDTVVARGDLEAELVGQVEHRGHLVGAIAVDVDEDVALDRRGPSVELAVALAAGVLVRVGLVGVLLLVLLDRKSTRLNSSHSCAPCMPSSA